MNNWGDVVGCVSGTNWTEVNGIYEDETAVVWRAGTDEPVELDLIAEAAGKPAGWHLLDARDINERGQIVGRAVETETSVRRGYFLDPGTDPPQFQLLPGEELKTLATHINNWGDIVGYRRDDETSQPT